MNALRAASLVFAVILAHAGVGAQEPPAEALRYHRVLIQRPDPGAIFDRFLRTWIAEDSRAGLLRFLTEQAKTHQRAGDYRLLARAHLTQNNAVAALAALEHAVRLEPDNARIFWERAEIHIAERNAAEALADLEKAHEFVENAELRAEIDRARGSLLLDRGDSEAALAIWTKLLESAPDDPAIWEDVIDLAARSGLEEQALKWQRDFMAKAKDAFQRVERQMRLGELLVSMERVAAGTQVYAEAFAKSGADSWLEKEILARVERAFLRLADRAGYDAWLAEQSRKNPGRAGLMRKRASQLAKLGDEKQAREVFAELLRKTPGDLEIRRHFVRFLRELGAAQEARDQLTRLLDLTPRDAELHFQLAELEHEIRSPEAREARNAAFGAFFEVSPNPETAAVRVVQWLEQANETEDAARLLAGYAGKLPDSVDLHDFQAAFWYRNGRKQEALDYWLAEANRAQTVEATLRIASALHGRMEFDLEFQVLTEAEPKHGADRTFLDQLIEVALKLERYDQAVSWMGKRMAQVENVRDLVDTIGKARAVYARAGRAVEAIGEIRALPAPTPAQICLVAELLTQTGQFAQADAVLAELEEREELLALRQRVRLAQRRRRYLEAVKLLERIAELPGGRNANTIREIVAAYEQVGDFRAALGWIRRWRELAPGLLDPWVTEVRVLRELGRLKDAGRMLERMAAKFPDRTNVRDQLAQLYLQTDRDEEAQAMYRRLYLDAEAPELKLQWVKKWARAAQEHNRHGNVIAELEQRRKLAGRGVLPLRALAEAHLAVDSGFEKGAELLERALRLDPGNAALRGRLAGVYRSMGQPEKALDLLEAGLMHQMQPTQLSGLISLWLEIGRTAEPERWWPELIRQAAGNESLLTGPLVALLDKREFHQTVQFAAPALEAHPLSVELGFLMGEALWQADRRPEAARHFVRVVEQSVARGDAPAQNRQPKHWRALAGLPDFSPQDPEEIAQQLLRSANNRRQVGNMRALFRLGNGYDLRTAALHRLAEVDEADFAAEDGALAARIRELQGDARWLVDLARGFPGWSKWQPLSAYAAEHPDSLPLHAGLVVRTAARTGEVLLPAYRRAYEILKEPRPGLALIAALQVANETERNRTLWLVNALAEIPVDQLNDVETLKMALWLFEDLESSAEPASRQLLEKTLGRLYRNVVGENGAGGEKFVEIAEDLSSDNVLLPRWEAEALLRAERIADANLPNHTAVRDYVDKLLPRLVEIDLELARRAFWKVCDLVKAEIAAGSWHHRFFNGYTIASDFLYRTLDECESFEGVTLALRLMAEDSRSEICSSFGYRFRLAEPIRESYDDGGGDKNLPASLHLTLTKLEKAREGLPVAYLSSACYYWMRMLDKRARYLALEWVDREAEGERYPELARELGMCLRRIAARYPVEQPNLDVHISQPNAWQRHYAEICADPTLTYSQRMQAVWSVYLWAKHQTGPELTLAAANLTAEALQNDATFTSGLMEDLLYAFTRLPDGEEWNAVAQKLIAGWEQQCNRGFLPQNGTFDFDPVKNTVVSMLGVYLRAGTPEQIAGFLADNAPKLAAESRVFAQLVRFGAHREAAEFFARHWRALPESLEFDVYFDTRLEAAIPEFLPKIAAEDLRYLAAIQLNSTPDRTLSNPLPLADSIENDRLSELARRFADVDFAQPAMRERALFLLADCSGAWPFLVEELRAAYDPGQVESAIRARRSSTAMKDELRLSGAYLAQMARSGQAQPLLDAIDAIEHLPNASNGYKQSAVAALGECFYQAATECWAQFEDDDAAWKACADVYQRLVMLPDSLHDSKFGVFPSAQIVHHAVAGKSAELEAWREPPGSGARMKTQESFRKNPNVYTTVRHLLAKGPPMDLERRLRLFEAIAADSWYRAAYSRPEGVIYHVHNWGLLSTEEILTNAKRLAKTHVRNHPEFARSLANFVASHDARLAERILRRGISDFEGEEREADWLRIRLAEFLRENERIGEMREVLEFLDRRDPDDQVKRRGRELLEPIKRR